MSNKIDSYEYEFLKRQVRNAYNNASNKVPDDSYSENYKPLRDEITKKLEAPDLVAKAPKKEISENTLRNFFYFRSLKHNSETLDSLYLFFSGLTRDEYLAEKQLPDAVDFDDLKRDGDNVEKHFGFLRQHELSEKYGEVLERLRKLVSALEERVGAPPRTRWLQAGLLVTLVACIVTCTAIYRSRQLAPVLPAPVVQHLVWNLVTTWPDNSTYSDVLRQFARQLEDSIRLKTGIALTVKINYNSHLPDGRAEPPESLLNHLRGPTPDFDLLHTTPYYYSANFNRTALYSAVPFGRFRRQMLDWLGKYIDGDCEQPMIGLRYIFATEKDSSILTYPGGFTGAQYAGWFRFETGYAFDSAMCASIDGRRDLLYGGRKGRYAGIAGRILEDKYKSKITKVPPSLIAVQAFEKHFDFYEWVGPGMDMEIGLHAVKGFNVYCLSCWHEPCTMMTLSVNENKLRELSNMHPEAKRIFLQLVDKNFYGITTDSIYERTITSNNLAMKRLDSLGIQMVYLDIEYLNGLRKNVDAAMKGYYDTLNMNLKVNRYTKDLFESYMQVSNPPERYLDATQADLK